MKQISRRNFVTGTATTLAGVAASGLMASSAKSSRSLRVAHITDMHLDTRPVAILNVAKVLKEINSMKDRPDLIINSGDSVFRSDGVSYDDASVQWNLLSKTLAEHNRIPMRSCLGNHDVWYSSNKQHNDQYKTQKRYWKNWALEVLDLPDAHYTYQKNNWQFIALDSINVSDYSLDQQQFSWLVKELDRIPATSPICIFSHVSILSIIPLLRSLKDGGIEDFHYPSSRQHTDALQLKDLFVKHPNVKLCLSGHTHQIDEVDFRGVKYLCGGAVAGNWWGDDGRPSLIFDGFPPAYTIIDLFEDGLISYENIFYKFTS